MVSLRTRKCRPLPRAVPGLGALPRVEGVLLPAPALDVDRRTHEPALRLRVVDLASGGLEVRRHVRDGKSRAMPGPIATSQSGKSLMPALSRQRSSGMNVKIAHCVFTAALVLGIVFPLRPRPARRCDEPAGRR